MGSVFDSAPTDAWQHFTVDSLPTLPWWCLKRRPKALMIPPSLRDRKPRRVEPSRPVSNAITQLAVDHDELQQMFTAFENTRSVNNKRFLVRRICTTLVVHAQLEEEIFLPAVESVVPQATPQHTAIKAMVAHIQSLEPVADQVDGPIQVLAQEMKEHASTLHTSLFPQVKASDIDLVELGDRMARRKAELMAQRA